jgi:hypothetical protein
VVTFRAVVAAVHLAAEPGSVRVADGEVEVVDRPGLRHRDQVTAAAQLVTGKFGPGDVPGISPIPVIGDGVDVDRAGLPEPGDEFLAGHLVSAADACEACPLEKLRSGHRVDPLVPEPVHPPVDL